MKCINKGTEKKPWVELTVWELPGTSSWWNIGHIEPYNMLKNSLYLLNQGQEFAMYCTMYPRYFPACIVWKWSRKCTYHSEGDGIQFHVCHNIFLSNFNSLACRCFLMITCTCKISQKFIKYIFRVHFLACKGFSYCYPMKYGLLDS